MTFHKVVICLVIAVAFIAQSSGIRLMGVRSFAKPTLNIVPVGSDCFCSDYIVLIQLDLLL